MKVRIEIDTKTFVRFWLVVIGFIAVIAAIWIARSALEVIAISLFLALALNPPVSRLSKLLPGRSRVGATLISYLVVIALLVGFLVTIVPPVIVQTTKFVESVPAFIDNVSQQKGSLEHFLDRYKLSGAVDQALNDVKDQAQAIASNLGSSLVGGVTVLATGAVNLIFILVLTFLMLVEGPSWMEKIWGLHNDPVRLKRHKNVVTRMYHVVVGFVNGQITVAGIAAGVALVFLFALSVIFQMPVSLVLPLAFILFLCELMPLIGPTIALIVLSLVLLFNNVTVAFIFAIYYLVYQQIENNYISPTIQSRSVDLSALSVLVAILVGVSLFGLLGAIISIPIAGCLRVILVDHLEHAKRERAERKNPPVKLLNKLKELAE